MRGFLFQSAIVPRYCDQGTRHTVSAGNFRSTTSPTRQPLNSAACRARAAKGLGPGWSTNGASWSFTSPDLSFASRARSSGMGTPSPCQRSGETLRLMMPQSRPWASTMGPPSEPGLMAAEVSMADPAYTLSPPWFSARYNPLTTPALTSARPLMFIAW